MGILLSADDFDMSVLYLTSGLARFPRRPSILRSSASNEDLMIYRMEVSLNVEITTSYAFFH